MNPPDTPRQRKIWKKTTTSNPVSGFSGVLSPYFKTAPTSPTSLRTTRTLGESSSESHTIDLTPIPLYLETETSMSPTEIVAGSSAPDKRRARSTSDDESSTERRRSASEAKLDALTPLIRFGIPISAIDESNDKITDIIFTFPSVLSPSRYRTNSPEGLTHKERVDQALEIGFRALEKEIPVDLCNRLTRREERRDFKEEVQLLDELLTHIRLVKKSSGISGYALRKSLFTAFNTRLLVRRNEFIDYIVTNGEGIPSLPIWGMDGNIRQFWEDNEFEIIAASYRAEVEYFLHYMNNIKTIVIDAQQKIKPSRKNVKFQGKQKERDSSINQDEPEDEDDEQDKIEAREVEESISMALARKRERSSKSYQGSTFPSVNKGSVFGRTTNSSGKRMNELFQSSSGFEREGPPHRESDQGKGNNRGTGRKGEKSDQDPPSSPSDPDSSGNDSDNNDNSERHPRLPRNSNERGRQHRSSGRNTVVGKKEPEFDHKLKVDIIPTWDGDADNLGRWITKINRLSERSTIIRRQLGVLVPTRLTGSAETWYYSLSAETRSRIEQDWTTLRTTIGDYYMNRAYVDKQKARANKATYRDYGHLKETPSEYYIRKLELLEMVYTYNDVELINEIMSGAPSHWVSILTPHLYQKLEDFQLAIKFHEEALMRMASSNFYSRPSNFNYGNNPPKDISRNPFNRFKDARANLIGWTPKNFNPPFPKDDANISPRATPEDKGGRPCRHCGSLKHWDPECKYARKGERKARVNSVSLTSEEIQAQEAYDELYYDLVSEDEESQDFREAPPESQET